MRTIVHIPKWRSVALAILLPVCVLATPQSDNVDKLLFSELNAKDITPSAKCSDHVFLRRVYIDLTGALPDQWFVRSFLEDKRPNKRRLLINRLMRSDGFADYWTMKWCDLLRVKAEFPINLWPNGAQAYAQWIHDSIAGNMRYDEFARKLLTSNGSNFRVPPVNFYRAVQGEKPEDIASVAALTFMGTRLDNWPEQRKSDLAAFFSRIQFKGTSEWKEVIVSTDPNVSDALSATLPDGKKINIVPAQDPRVVFADWLISADNEWFARNIANRTWAWFFGTGLIHEVDDIDADNPPIYPNLLAYLEKEFVRSGYDMQHLFRIILNSQAYQQSSELNAPPPDSRELFARYPVRRLEAEVLLDALSFISGSTEGYMSMIPEPFTFIPARQKTVALTDGSITSKFLKMFGRPSRDTGLESERNNDPNDAQRLHMLNSSHVQSKIQNGWKLRNLTRGKRSKQNPVEIIYLTALSRFPTVDELTKANEYNKQHGKSKGSADLLWAVINSKEFLYRH